MTPTSHLTRIRARCVELLAIAEKRTPGEWTADHIYVDTNDKAVFIKADGNLHNAVFIASCAGAAEASWRSTIAAIDYISRIMNDVEHKAPGECERCLAECMADAILAAWPEELL